MLRLFRSTCYHPLPSPIAQRRSALLGRSYRSTDFSLCSPTPVPLVRLSAPSVASTTRRLKSKSALHSVSELDEAAENVEPTFTLRPYQIECILAILNELQTGACTRLGVSAPTGSGKTAIFTRLISLLPSLRHPTTNELANRVLIIVNSIQLAQQTYNAIARAYPDSHVELEQGTKHKASGYADVTIATFQTLGRDGGKRLDKFETEYFKAVIVDEAHHAVSKTYLSILSRFDSAITESFTSPASVLTQQPLVPSASPIVRAGEEDAEALAKLPRDSLRPLSMKLDDLGRPRVPILAFSATWTRADGLALGKVFEKLVFHAEWLDMIESNWLSELKFTTLRVSPSQGLNLDNVEVSRETGEFVLGSLVREVDRDEVNDIAVRTWLEKASDRRSTLVFAISISHILSLANKFRQYGIDARFVYQDTKASEREAIYEGFRNGDFRVLVNCGILTEGADFPSIDCILLLRPTRSQTLFLQMLGRGLRLSPETGKKDCLVIDLVGSGARAGGMVCTPTLFGVDPEAAIEGESTSALRRLGETEREQTARASPESKSPRNLRVEYTEYETAFDYVSSASSGESAEDDGEGPKHISRLSKLAWIGCGEDVWVLELMGKGHVKIAKTRDGFVASLYLRLPPSPFDQLAQSRGPPSPYMTPRLLALHRSLPLLLRSTDQFLLSRPEYSSLGLARTSPWRRNPASTGQRDFILKKLNGSDSTSRKIDGVWLGAKLGTLVDVDGLEKGQASDLISRTKHGGMGYVKKFKRDYQRGVREKTREQRKDHKVGQKLKAELEEVGKRKKRAELGA